MIYADNAATTPVSPAARAAMIDAMDRLWGNPSSLYAFGQRAEEALSDARARVAGCLGAEPGEIVFTSGGSEADNQALRSGAAFGAKKGKKHIISTAFEHHAVLHTLDALRTEGFEVTLLPVHADGLVRPEELAAALRPDTALVSVMFANNEIGTIQPVARLGEICRQAGVLFHTDAVQAAGHIAIDVKAMHIDMLSLSGHKFHGPKGVGALYVRRGVPVAPLIYGGAQERRRRAGTENLPAITGMAAALEEACAHLEVNAARVSALRDRLIAGLSAIPHAALNGAAEPRLPGNVNFCFEGIEGESLLLMLDEAGIAASSGSACTSGSLDPSHVLLAIGLPHEIAHGSLRLTLNHLNTQEEIDRTIAELKPIVERLREMSPLFNQEKGGCQLV